MTGISERWETFWSRGPTDRPLIGVAIEGPGLGILSAEHSGELRADRLDPESHAGACDAFWREVEGAGGDSVWAASAFQGLPWTEAICGCQIRPSGDSYWADRPRSRLDVCLDSWRDSPWLAMLKETTRTLAARQNRTYPVGIPVLRGPADVLSALMGPQAFALAAYDDPMVLAGLMDRCTEVCREVYTELLDLLDSFDEGFVQASRQVWAPGPCIETQQDAASILSIAHYRQFIRSSDEELTGIAPYQYRHLHSGALQHLRDVLELPGLAAVQITIDEAGPPLEAVGEAIRTVQAAGKPAIVHGSIGPAGMAKLVSSLSPVGLYIAARARSRSAAASLLREAAALIDVT